MATQRIMYQITTKQITSFDHPELNKMFELNQQIPELDIGISLEVMTQRITEKPFLLLLAYVEGDIAGYKLGYAIDNANFYSWIGGVAQDFRKLGIAETLLKTQEQWVQAKQYHYLTVKTQNRYNAMLSMLIKHQYQIIEIDQNYPDSSDYKMRLVKRLQGEATISGF